MVGMSDEQKKKQSERMKARWAKKRAAQNAKSDDLPTVEEATIVMEEAAQEIDAELPTVEEAVNMVEAPIITPTEEVETAEVPPMPQPVRVTYLSPSRNFKLTLADPRRGRTLVDNTKVRDKTLRFNQYRYETKSMEERVGIETSPSFLCHEIEIFLPKGTKRLYPDMPREGKNRAPTEQAMIQIMGIASSNDERGITRANSDQ